MSPRGRVARFPLALLAGAALIAPQTAGATVDALLETTIVVAHSEVETFCYFRVPVSAELGIPAMALVDGSLAPSYALRSASPLPPEWLPPEIIAIGGRQYENINVLAHGAALAFRYEQDVFSASGTLELRGVLDVSALAAEQGDSVAGRQATVDRAKLALLAIAKDLKESNAFNGGKYRLYLSFEGLPSQDGLRGGRLYAQTSVPYSGGSPLLAAYEQELIDASVCGTQSALYGKADTGGAVAAATPATAGCAVGGGASARAGCALLALLGLLALLRARRAR